MEFESPYWALVGLMFVALARWFPWVDLGRPLRMICAAVFVLVLMRPVARVREGGLDLWVLMDRSASASGMEALQGDEILDLLERSRPLDGVLRVADFGAEVRERFGARAELRTGETRLRTALEWVLGRCSGARSARVLMVTDGQSTEPLDGMAAKAVAAGVPLDVRWLVDGGEPDFQVDAIELPQRAGFGEAFLVQGRVHANVDEASVPYSVLRDGVKVGSGTVQIRKGRGLIRFSDRLRVGGPHAYAVELFPEKDRVAENNRSEGWVLVEGGSDVLVLSPFAEDPVVRMLESNGLKVRHLREGALRGVADLAGTGLIVFNNFRADRLPEGFRRALPFFVQERGGGILMLGGRGSFAAGGYHGSEVDGLMPVSMDARDQQRKAAVALAIMMDRSGSMGASPAGVRGAPGTLTKMDLANEGAANGLALLMPNDVATVFAVDTSAHEVVPVGKVGRNPAPIFDAVRSIRSEGGGIFIGEALRAGWGALKAVDLPVRHMILFSDAADSEMPDDYRATLKEATDAGVTVSVIGLGSETDKDAALLREVAELGGGRMFFQSDAFGIPALFAQEAMMVARPSFSGESLAVTGTAGWGEVAAGRMQWLDRVDGFNATIARQGATVALRAVDGNGDPLVAFWHSGAGRTAAVGFPVAGEFSDAQRNWPGLSEMLGGLARWAAAGEHPPGVDVGVRLRGNVLETDFFYGQEYSEQIAKFPPVLKVSDQRGEVRVGEWDRMTPGHFRAQVAMKAGDIATGVVRAGGWTLPFGPIAIPASAEWVRDVGVVGEVRLLVQATGGRERVDLSECWAKPDRLRREHPLRGWLLSAWVVLVVADAFWTRVSNGARRRF